MFVNETFIRNDMVAILLIIFNKAEWEKELVNTTHLG